MYVMFYSPSVVFLSFWNDHRIDDTIITLSIGIDRPELTV